MTHSFADATWFAHYGQRNEILALGKQADNAPAMPDLTDALDAARRGDEGGRAETRRGQPEPNHR